MIIINRHATQENNKNINEKETNVGYFTYSIVLVKEEEHEKDKSFKQLSAVFGSCLYRKAIRINKKKK